LPTVDLELQIELRVTKKGKPIEEKFLAAPALSIAEGLEMTTKEYYVR
jgi:hypothetical protein